LSLSLAASANHIPCRALRLGGKLHATSGKNKYHLNQY